MSNRYMAVSVPKELVQVIDDKIKGRGYNSRAEFVKESGRMALERIEKLNKTRE